MTAPVITPLPTPPTRADAPSDFTAKADAFVAAQVVMAGEINASAEFVDQRAIAADSSAQAAESSASAAQGHASNAEAEKDAAVVAAGGAAAAASASAGSASAADASALAAANSADDAAGSVIAADAQRQGAEAARQGAEDARDAAEYWADQAQQSAEGGIIDDTSLLATRVRSALDASRGHFRAVVADADVAIIALDFAQITAEGESVTVTLPTDPEPGQLVMAGNLTDRLDHRIAVGSVPVKGQDAGGYIIIDKPRFTITLKYISAGYGWEVI